MSTSSPSPRRAKRVGTSPSAWPNIACSAAFQPAPTPRTKRPPERLSSAAAWRASVTGSHVESGETSAPKRTRAVWSARWARATISSSEGRGGAGPRRMWSES